MPLRIKGDKLALVPAASLPYSVLSSFLEKRPQACVQLYERLEKAFQSEQSAARTGFICLTGRDSLVLYGIVFASEAGLVLHSINAMNPSALAEAVKLFSEFFQGRAVYCISGEAYGSRLLELAVAKAGTFPEPVERRKYLLMQFASRNAGGKKREEIPVELCAESQLDKLLPLQYVYDKVEVLPANRSLDKELCRKTLLRTLLQGRVYGIRSKEGFAAKAAVNAMSKAYWQIGGVFTLPEFRCRGYASRLARFIATKALSQGKSTVLFVRTENSPAISAYKNAGFKQCGDYTITYY